jgi:transglutaminase-like putative cysteine protease
MIYRIVHRTSFRYARPVFESFNEVRLQPVQGETQTLLDFDLAIDPPATVIAFRDYYGNAVHDFGVTFLHDELTIEATSEVLTHAAADEPLAGPAGDDDDSVDLAGLAADDAFADEFAEFLGPSRYVVLEDASADMAADLRQRVAGASALRFLQVATTTVRERLEYRIGATTVHSSVAEVLAGGSGVCQDFAHLLISLCRHAGLPARYVSGYLGSVGSSSASHAWVEAYVPPYGWIGVDATLGEPCTGRHVKLGVGRDYADVAVLRGTYQGGGEAALDVRVTSEELGPAGAIGELAFRGEGSGRRLVAIQNLGALRQFQRGTVMLQSVGGLGHTLALEDIPPPRGQRRGEDEVPSQQPQQQQQRRPRGSRCC